MLAGAVVLACAALSAAPELSPEQVVYRARACLEDLDFACAETAYLALEPRLAELSPDLALEARVLGAEIALSTERWAEAETRLIAVLRTQPRFSRTAESWPPPWLETLQRARARGADRTPPQIAVTSAGPAAEGTPLVVHARIVDASRVERAVLHLAARADRPFAEHAMTSTDGASFRATVPGPEVNPPELSAWVEAWDEFGNGPARGEPIEVAVQARANDEGPGWWLWALVGGAVVAGGVGAALALGARETSVVTVGLTWPAR